MNHRNDDFPKTGLETGVEQKSMDASPPLEVDDQGGVQALSIESDFIDQTILEEAENFEDTKKNRDLPKKLNNFVTVLLVCLGLYKAKLLNAQQ